jgi:ubiquinone/menaquinone biosynthesis C-methylase UbiE
MTENTEIIYEIFNDLPRGSPGSQDTTKKAYLMLKRLPSQPLILDIGCGPGMQTLELARISKGQIIALDVYQPFLNRINQIAVGEGLGEKIKTLNKSMLDMDFQVGRFDLIWAEGAIYIIGFERGLKEWKQILKKSGSIVVSELTWLKKYPPEEIFQFFKAEYPAMKIHEANLKTIDKAGYQIINSFVQPESDWLNYYNPLEKKVAALREKYRTNIEATQFLDLTQTEIDLYKKYSKYYGYVFYLMQKK